MVRFLRRLTTVLSLFAYSLIYGQGTCTYSESSFGADNTNYVEFSDFNCVDTVTNSFITEAEISVSNLGWNCPSWYYFNLEVNGTTVAEDLCSISATDLSTYDVDINNLSSVKIYSQNGDTWVDNNTITATLDLTYIVTTCPPPSGVTASNINPTTADIIWSSNGSETLWNIEVVNLTAGDTATGIATYSGVTVNPYSLSSLSPENDYAVFVQSDCGPFNTTPLSDWSFGGTFTTPPTCLPLGTISIDSVAEFVAELSWAQAGSETSWDIELINTSLIPADTFTYTPNNAGLSTNNPLLSGLVPESDYQFIVRANCGVIDGPSAWTSVYNFTTLPTCQAPEDLDVDSYTNNEITFSWTAIDNESLWYVEYVNLTLSETQTGLADDSSTTASYTALNLDANSEYAIYVSAGCGGTDGNSEWIGPLLVLTSCNPVAMPFSEPFSTWIPECFDVDNGDAIWGPYVSSGDTLAARARNSGSTSAYGTHRHLLTPNISVTQEALLTFSWSHKLYNWNDDTLRVNLSNDGGASWNTVWSVTGAAFNSNDGAGSNYPGSYKDEALLINGAYVGTDVLVDIEYASENSYGYGVFIDTMSVTALPACNIPYYVVVDSVDGYSADMSFVVAGAGATTYEIEMVTGVNTPTGIATDTVTGTPFTITGLIPGTNYSAYARTMCGTDSTVWVGPIAFTTDCAPLADYYTSFEGYSTGDPINCWNMIDSTSSSSSYVKVYNSSSLANTGTGYIRFYHPSSASPSTSFQFAVLPELSTVITQDHRLRFYGREANNDGNMVIVGTMSDPTDVNTFTVVDSVMLTNQHVQYTVNFNNYTGTDTYVAIQLVTGSNSGSEYLYLDDVEWQEIPNCFPPTSITIDSLSTTSVSVSMDSVGTYGAEWYVEMEDVSGVNPTVLYTATTIPFTVGGLEPSTVYEMTISTNCSNAISEGTSMEFQTVCGPISEFDKDFSDLVATNDTSICWTYLVETTTFAKITSSSSSFSSHSPMRYLRMYNSSDLNPELLLITPELSNITAGTNIFTFWARSSSSAQPSPFEVGTITDITDPSTFTSIYSGAVSNSYDSIVVPFLSYTGTDVHIAIKFNPTTTYDYLYIDDVKWGEAPDCSMPVGFNIADLTDQAVTLDWLNVSPDTVWNLELVEVLNPSDVYDSIPTDTAFVHPFAIGGLTENTIYDVYLSNPCDTTYADIQLSFVTPWGNNVGVTAILSPALKGCNLSDSMQIEVEIENFGGQAATGFPVELSWDDSIYFNAGTFNDTIIPGGTATFILDGYYDFSASIDSSFFVRTLLASDSVATDDMSSSSVTNLGNMYVDVVINNEGGGTANAWLIMDTLNNIINAQDGDMDGSGNLSSYTTYTYSVCVFPNTPYVINAYDEYGGGWSGGTYEINRCGGILIANNDGNSVDNGLDTTSWPNYWELEASEVFIVEECPDYDLALISIDSLETSCGLGIETGYVKIANFGNFDVAANGATAQYQFNNSGLWVDFWDFDSGLASQTDTLYQLPSIDMSTPGIYTIDIQIVFPADQNPLSNSITFELSSTPSYTTDSTGFNSDNGYWYSEIYSGTNDSWEWGIPTTQNIGNNNDGKVWALNLTGDVGHSEYSYLYSPCYDFSDYTDAVEISFDYVRVGSNHNIRLQRSFNGGASWYTWPTSQFPQSNTNDWTHTVRLLSGMVGQPQVIFRWRFYTYSFQSDFEGFGFDNWQVKEHVPYTDASLMDLTVNGNTVSDPVAFQPDTFNYTYEVPYGSTTWDVDADFTMVNPLLITSMTITEPTSLPGMATVVVVAEDTNYVSTYSVYITEALAATDATLSALSVSNSSVPGFNPDTLCYTITYPYGSTFMPSVSAIENDPNANAVVTNVSVPGTCTIEVTAEDGVTVNTYCINYEVESLSSNAYLSDIQLDGISITGFQADSLTYYVELPNGVTSVPLTNYTPADPNCIVSQQLASIPLPDTTVFTVTAQDGVTVLVYSVIFTEAPSSDASLMDLTINGGTISGFSSQTFVYDIELPFNSIIPNVGGLTTDTGATEVVVDASGVPGTTIVTVTAEDGTISTYFINWTYAAANDDTSLDSLMTNVGYFCMISGSDTTAVMMMSPVDENTYNLTVGAGFASLVNMTIVATDPNATVVVSGSATFAPYGEVIITVTAEDGTTQEVYTVNVISDDCSIGLDEAILGQITVSPNPSSGVFSIASPSSMHNYSLQVINQLGKVVYSDVVQDESVQKSIDLSSLAAGVYSLRINSSDQMIVKRISILK